MRSFPKIILAALLLVPLVSFAQTERSYRYASINTDVTVNADTTVDIAESQTYAFTGEYHLGWRSIPHNKIDAVTGVSVIDASTGAPLQYSSSRLNKDDPSSWGKYTVYGDNGATDIEWYYNLAGTPDPGAHTWILKYTVHGALSFYKDHDELYWNLFTDYSVPVDSVEATIHLPAPVTAPQAAFYTSSAHEYVSSRPTDSSFYFSTGDIAPNESVTFAVGWQKGMIDQRAYWLDALKIYWPFVAGALIFIGSVLFSIFYWRKQEYIYRGKGTIVPQYEPPSNLPPAMAEVVMKRYISARAWPATIIDLAVRGFVTIEEKETAGVFGWGKSKDYAVTRTGKDITELKRYEEKFVEALFDKGRKIFSTKEISESPSRQRAMAGKMTAVKDLLYEEAEADTDSYTVGPKELVWRKKMAPLGFIIGAVISVPFFFISSTTGLGALLAGISAFLIVYVMKLRPQLNTQGHILKEEWLGFKMFLEVTGKDRMQNLTPDMFEKYLPYAMIFNVEKQWAKKFESLNLPAPQWFTNSGMYVSPGGAGSFSPSSFAAGFSASFASSFASSGGAGASGGGGGAGGGGGGGGGGAA